MIKKIIFYLVSFLVLFGITFSLHSYILANYKVELRFSLLEIYGFHFITSFIISAGILLLSNSQKWSSQLGFIYIFTFISKFIFFAAAFKESIFKIESFTKTESLNLLIPLFFFLILEVYFIAKVLNRK